MSAADSLPRFDIEVEIVTKNGKTETTVMGYSDNDEEACARCLRCRSYVTNPEESAVSVRALRIVKTHAPMTTVLSDLVTVMDGPRWCLVNADGHEAVGEYAGGHMRDAWMFLTKAAPLATWRWNTA